MTRYDFILSLCLCCSLIYCKGQVDSSVFYSIDNMLDEVVITAQHGSKTVEESVHLVRVLNKKRIRDQAATNLRELLQMETGMRISQDNLLGSSLSLQGLSGQNVKILVDGVPVIGRLNGNVDLSQISLNNIERVELIQGPLSVNFGTDALAGTINLITKKINKDGLKMTYSSYYETVGQYNINSELTNKKGLHTLQFSGGRNFFDGWDINDPFIEFPKAELADTNRSIQWNIKEQFFSKIGYSYDNKHLHISPYISYFNEKITNRGMPRRPYFENAFDDYYSTFRSNVGTNLSGKLPWGGNWNAVIAFNNFKRIKNSFYIDLTSLQSELTTNPSDQDTSWFGHWMSRGSMIYKVESLKSSVELGYDLSFEQTRGYRILDSYQDIGDMALFATAEIDLLKNLLLRPGLRASYNTDYISPLTPSLNIKYNYRDHVFRASYARGFRAPSLKELYFEFVDINHNIFGNSELLSERSHNLSASFTWKDKMDKGLLSLTNSLFFNHITDRISLGQILGSNVYEYVNIGLFKSTGVNGDLSWNTKRYSLLLGWSCIGRFNEISTFHTVAPFSFSPEFRSQVNYKFKKSDANISLFWKYNGVTPSYSIDSDGDISLNQISDYQTLDIIYTKKIGKKGSVLSFGGKNLLNVQNITISGSNDMGVGHSESTGAFAMSWGRSIFTSIKLNLK